MSSLRLERDVVFFDLEATGTDPARDRIVQVALVRLSPDGTRRPWDSLVDPETPIPPESSQIHGITDAMVRTAPRFRDLAPKLLEQLKDADLGGFGLVRYDIPLLTAEFKRAGIAFDVSGRKVVDALTIFHRLESRTLAAAYAFYCGKRLEHAHNALADAEASLEVLLAQVGHYQGRPDRPDLPEDLAGLAEFCGAGADAKNVDSRGKFVWRHGQATFNFGKHQTKSLQDVVRLDRAYVEWLACGEASTPEVSEICRKALGGEFPQKPNGGAAS